MIVFCEIYFNTQEKNMTGSKTADPVLFKIIHALSPETMT